MKNITNPAYTKARSNDWLRAYIFATLERKLFKEFVRSPDSCIKLEVTIPKVWFGVKCSSDPVDDINRDRKGQLSNLIREDLKEFFPNYVVEVITWNTVHQYINVQVRIRKEVGNTELQEFLRVLDKNLHKDVKLTGIASLTIDHHITRSELRELCSQFGINYELCVLEGSNGD